MGKKGTTRRRSVKNRTYGAGNCVRSELCCCGFCKKDVSGLSSEGRGHALPKDQKLRGKWLTRLGVTDSEERQHLLASTCGRVYWRHFYDDGDSRIDIQGTPGRWYNGSRHVLSKGACPGRGPAEWAAEDDPGRRGLPTERAREGAAARAEGAAASSSPQTRRTLGEAAAHLRREFAARRAAEDEAATLRRQLVATVLELQTSRAAHAVTRERMKQLEVMLAASLAKQEKLQREHDTAVQKLHDELVTWKASHHNPLRHEMMRDDEYLSKRIPQLTGFKSYEAFLLFVECLKADGVLDSVQLYRGAHDEEGKLASASDNVVVRPGGRSLDATNAVFFALFVLRTGIEPILAGPLFGCLAPESYFTSYVNFLCSWLQAEFPYPTKEQIIASTPKEFAELFAGWDLENIFDAMEQVAEMALVCAARGVAAQPPVRAVPTTRR